MAYENLLNSVDESAQERERELRERGKTLAEEIRTNAKREAEELQSRAIREAERSAAIERNKQLYLTKGGIKEKSLRSREQVFLAAFNEAEKQLAGIRGDSKYPAVFERLAREAVGTMENTPFRIHVDRRDLEICNKTLATLGVRCEVLTDITCAGGLVASSPDGLVVISNTVGSRLERIRELKRREIYAILSGG
ncbi:V-type ATP synthase subunit E [uncultured Methanoregula sp.]|uniref:V-type ATP synthase subunit E n=1 Tax=uncultured Methanoregula sp. TaxID=1005933 RepID=UPI002AAAB602|nr:V-type ATP synthase subunit E [uncultured Methanoregula sp.]